MKKSILITGCSSGLGFALTNYYLKNNYTVYGVSRNNPNISNHNFIHKNFDLSNISQIKEELSAFILDIKKIDTVFLNAELLGKIKLLNVLSIEELNEGIIQNPDETAQKIFQLTQKLDGFASGSYVDIRDITVQ